MHTHDMHDEISNDTNNSNNNIILISDSSRKGLQPAAGEVDSPLRVALSTNPLLTASLNSPPVHMAAAASSQSLSVSANGSVDLSSHASSLRSKRLLVGNEPADRISPDGHTSPSSSSTATSSKEMYANLLMQLRNQGITAAQSSNSEETPAAAGPLNNKMSAAARKEKLKSQLCFQCPVCKKRFQRHIAMNAHFQAEHLGSLTSKSDGCKVCKLCAYVGQDMSSIRHHLLVKHSIDLDTPTACLAEPDTNPASPGGGGNSRSGSSSPLPSSSSDKKSLGSSLKHANNNNSNTYTSSPAVSIIRTTVVPKSEDGFITSSSASSISRSSLSPGNAVIHDGLHLQSHVKQERRSEIEVEEAKDLSMKKTVLPKRSASPAAQLLASTSSDCSSSTSGHASSISHFKKRHKTERVSQRIVISSTPPSSPASNLVMQQTNSQWQCPHCNITFPDQTLYFLHRGFHSNTNPWKCNGCGQRCTDMYDFNTHLMSDVHH